MKSNSRERLEQALAIIADPDGEGSRACLTVFDHSARVEADASDARRRAGLTLGPLDGVVISVKDLFDVAGEPTRAGSRVLADEAAPAPADAPVIRRLRAAGAVVVAKTNMTEFAFSGVGMNPHYGTPGNPFDRARIPGGSSSGAAVAVADGMCQIAIGTDTGGSTRIPAALCSLVGFKPTQQRIPRDGAVPLSFTLDSVGPIARTVTDCAVADAIMAGDELVPLEPAPLKGLRFGIAQGLPLQGLDDEVGRAFAAGIDQLAKAGVRVSEEQLPQFDEMLQVNSKGGFGAAEAYAIHRERLQRRGDDIDPNVRLRIERGREISAADYIDMVRQRSALVRSMDARLADLDALVMPTTPIVAPRMAELGTPDAFGKANLALLRNPAIGNFFDLCGISLPLPQPGALPVGLMLLGRRGDDKRLLRIAAAVELAFAA